jgi:hypothetical protein
MIRWQGSVLPPASIVTGLVKQVAAALVIFRRGFRRLVPMNMDSGSSPE